MGRDRLNACNAEVAAGLSLSMIDQIHKERQEEGLVGAAILLIRLGKARGVTPQHILTVAERVTKERLEQPTEWAPLISALDLYIEKEM